MKDLNPQELYIYECCGNGQPRGEPESEGFLGIWPEGMFCYLFFDREALDSVGQWLKRQDSWILQETYQLAYEQWQQIPAGDQTIGPFVVRMSAAAETAAVSTSSKLIRLNPGVVFGSGLHPTTKGCLLAIADAVRTGTIGSVVDFGTGTGILAIAAAVLGVPRVLAVDCNPLAVKVAQGNVLANGVEERVKFLTAKGLDVLRRPADLLVMNIEWPCLKEALRSADWLKYPLTIMSGFIAPHWHEFKRLVPPACKIVSREILDDWVTVVVESR